MSSAKGRNPEQQSVMVQGIYRSNYVILGIPIVSNIYKGDNIATITMLIAIIVRHSKYWQKSVSRTLLKSMTGRKHLKHSRFKSVMAAKA